MGSFHSHDLAYLAADDRAIAALRRLWPSITHTIDTHIHADFVSGSRELAAIGARILAGPGAKLDYEHVEVAPGLSVDVGDLTLTCLHTPGHTPEHISIVMTA